MAEPTLSRDVAGPLLQLVQQTIVRYEAGEITEADLESVAMGVRIAIRSRVGEEEATDG